MRRRYRSLVALILLALIASTAVAWLSAGGRRSALEQAAFERLRAGTAVVASRLSTAGGSTEGLQRLAEGQASLLRARVTLIGADGRVVADSAVSERGVALMDDHRRRPEIEQAALGGIGENVRRSSTTGVAYLYGARRIDDEDAVRYVRLAEPWDPVRRNVRNHGIVVGFWSLLATWLVAGTMYLGLRRRERALQRYAGEVRRAVEAGETIPTGTWSSPYLAGIGSAVAALEASRDLRIREVEADRGLLASVIGGMQDGLLLVGRDRRVRLANDALRANLAVGVDPTGRHVTEAVRHPAVIEEIDAAFEEGGIRSDSVVRVASTGQTFRLHTVALDRDGGTTREVLVLFFDITRLEQLESVRREFVANVSHELRTPLTSIKAFVEALIDGGLDDRDDALRFLGIVRKHSDRMGELIEDLTDLSLIETGSIRLEIESVDAGAAAREIVGRLVPHVERRDLRVRVDLPEGCRVVADRRRLEQVLTNLVDNAVKFSRPGGSIVITGEMRDDATVLRVRDDGIGIARDAQQKIFHRFHRERRDGGDDSRGTGLGLAIVKHLMRLHGGTVHVESELGHGAEFVVVFPLRPIDGPA